MKLTNHSTMMINPIILIALISHLTIRQIQRLPMKQLKKITIDLETAANKHDWHWTAPNNHDWHRKAHEYLAIKSLQAEKMSHILQCRKVVPRQRYTFNGAKNKPQNRSFNFRRFMRATAEQFLLSAPFFTSLSKRLLNGLLFPT